MTTTAKTETGAAEKDLHKEEFKSYLQVLFPLIEGNSNPAEVRNLLSEYLSGNKVPAEIESMLKDLFQTKFDQSF